MNPTKYKKQKPMTAVVTARVNADDVNVLKTKGFNVSAIIQDAIRDAARHARKLSD